MILNPWKQNKLLRRGLSNAVTKVEQLEGRVAALEGLTAVSKDLVAAKDEVITALADFIRDHEWGIDAHLEDLLKR